MLQVVTVVVLSRLKLQELEKLLHDHLFICNNYDWNITHPVMFGKYYENKLIIIWSRYIIISVTYSGQFHPPKFLFSFWSECFKKSIGTYRLLVANNFTVEFLIIPTPY